MAVRLKGLAAVGPTLLSSPAAGWLDSSVLHSSTFRGGQEGPCFPEASGAEPWETRRERLPSGSSPLVIREESDSNGLQLKLLWPWTVCGHRGPWQSHSSPVICVFPEHLGSYGKPVCGTHGQWLPTFRYSRMWGHPLCCPAAGPQTHRAFLSVRGRPTTIWPPGCSGLLSLLCQEGVGRHGLAVCFACRVCELEGWGELSPCWGEPPARLSHSTRPSSSPTRRTLTDLHQYKGGSPSSFPAKNLESRAAHICPLTGWPLMDF